MLFRSAILLGFVLTAAGAGAQTPAQPLPSSPSDAPIDTHATFRSAVDMVTLNVTVTDQQDRHVSGLNKGDFQVLEDGVPQDLTFFAANQLPLDVALLVDSSSSMGEKMAFVRAAAGKFLKTLGGADRAEVVGFNSQVRVLQPFTSDFSTVERAIGGIVARGGTSLYTALYVTLDQFMKAARSAEVRRPAIVLLTDGQDTSSLIQFDDLLDRARRAGVAIYSISVMSPFDAEQLSSQGGRRFVSDSDYALVSLAKETGARAVFPLKLDELDGVYASIASELSLQYALGYAPPAARVDGSFHRVLVRVVSRPDARPRTRMGYYSPRAAASLVQPGR